MNEAIEIIDRSEGSSKQSRHLCVLARPVPGVSPGLAEPKAVRLIEGRKELGERHAERAGEAIDDMDGRRLTSSLEVGDVGPMEPAPSARVNIATKRVVSHHR